MLDENIVQRFWSKVDKSSECWLWNASLTRPNGYGIMKLPVYGKRLAHRISWELHHRQDVPNGLFVLHTCDVPRCVNPAHLFLGTQKDNVQDMFAKNRQNRKNVCRGTHHHNARLTNEDVTAILLDTRPQSAIAEAFRVPQSTVSKIKNGAAWRHVTHHLMRPPNHKVPGNRKLTTEQVQAIVTDQRTCVAIAKDYNMSNQQISNIKRGTSWQCCHKDVHEKGEI